MREEEFDGRYEEALHNIAVAMAEHPDIDPEKFYSIACILENMRFFSPVFYALLQPGKKN